MNTHRNARLGLAGRHELVRACQAVGQRATARHFGVSPATANKWFSRWQAAAEADRSTLTSLFDRSSKPRRSPKELAADEQARICEVREKTGWGPRLIAGMVG